VKKNNTHTYIINLIVWILGIIKAFSQSNSIPDQPKQLRSLPDNFKENYNGQEFDYIEHISFLDRLKAWFIDLLSSWFDSGSRDAENIFQNIKYTFYFLVIGAVIYYVAKLIVNKEGRWLFSKNPENNNDIDLEEVQNIKEEDFKNLITEAEALNDYRSAIKYYYLFLLKKMDLAEVIKYDSQKTSHDYLLQLEGKPYYTNFSKSAYYYTYIWYGEFEIDMEGYRKASSSFVELLNQFNNE